MKAHRQQIVPDTMVTATCTCLPAAASQQGPTDRPAKTCARKDGGFTLVELIVATGIFLLLMVLVMTIVLSVTRATRDTRQFSSINEQARLATDRVTRELRQAKAITAVVIPTTSTGAASLTFEVDFNGNGVIDTASADPETVTYRYTPSNNQLTLTANDPTGVSVTRPILSDNVSAFTPQYRSSLWQYDRNGDGLTDWTELDATLGVGNQNGVLDSAELDKIDLIVISLTVLEGVHQQTYQTQVGLRNRSQS